MVGKLVFLLVLVSKKRRWEIFFFKVDNGRGKGVVHGVVNKPSCL